MRFSKTRDLNMTSDSIYRKYQHYKNNKHYEVIGEARHSETLEEMIIYIALCESEQFAKNQVWVRPKKMFFEEIDYNGVMVRRFAPIED
jgi:hypothetical protein